MAGISQKMFPPEELKKQVNIRVLPEKMQIYPRFKELVTKQMGSDVCFVTASLWELFVNAMDQVPPNPADPVEMKFLRQNVQINLGCQILYQPKKARRTPGSKVFTGSDPSFPNYIDKHHDLLLPGLLDQWKTMKPKAQEFWRKRLQEAGIIPPDPSPPSGSTPTQDKPLKKFFKILENSIAFARNWLKRKFWGD